MQTVAQSQNKRNFFSSPFFNPAARIRDVLMDLDQIPPLMVRTAAMEAGSSAPMMRVMLERLARHVDVTHGDCYPTQRQLAGGRVDAKLRWHIDTVRKALIGLEKLGLVRRLRGKEAWAVYLEREPHRDLRCGAYLLTAWARRHQLVIRPGVEAPTLSAWARSRQRENEKMEGARKYAVSKAVARKLARAAGIDLDVMVGGITAATRKEHLERRKGGNVQVPAIQLAASAKPSEPAQNGRYQPRLDRSETSPREANQRLLVERDKTLATLREKGGAFLTKRRI